MRVLAALLAVAAGAIAAPETASDMMHPRSPGTPLEIVYKPFYCPLCLEEGRIEGPARQVTMYRLPVDEMAKRIECAKDWLVIATPNFRILSTLKGTKVKFKDMPFVRADLERLKTIFPKVNIGRDTAFLDAHERAHLYHIRVERIYCHFAALTNNKKPLLGMESPYELYLLDDLAEYYNLTDQFVGRGQKMPGIQHHEKAKPNFMCFMTSEQQVAQSKGKGDALFSNWVIHNVAHNLIDGHDNYYRETFAWMEEGIAHYYERLECERYNTFCWSEGKPPGDFKKVDWESTVSNIVRRGKDTPLSAWCEKLQPGELTGLENGLSWSIVKWLVETDPLRFAKMLEKVDDFENKPSSEQCIDHGFGCSPAVLHQRWRDYVRENYK
jgi:hypothetical protein